ncbi:hypothetical protein FKM82_013785 [Ascaphus truei]
MLGLQPPSSDMPTHGMIMEWVSTLQSSHHMKHTEVDAQIPPNRMTRCFGSKWHVVHGCFFLLSAAAYSVLRFQVPQLSSVGVEGKK